MPVPKTLGIETEYGIVHRGVDDPNPISASSLLINAYLSRRSEPGVGPGSPRVGWDFVDETPHNDVRGFSHIPRSRRTSSMPSSPTGPATTSIMRTPS